MQAHTQNPEDSLGVWPFTHFNMRRQLYLFINLRKKMSDFPFLAIF